MEKIDSYIPKEVKQIIRNDVELFELFKKDSANKLMQINTNYFMNKFIENFFDDYMVQRRNYHKNISGKLSNLGINTQQINDISHQILNDFIFSDDYNSNSKSNERLYFRPIDKTAYTLEYIDLNLEGDSKSKFIARMLIAYSKLPQYEREKIIFKDIYNKVFHACKNNSISISYSLGKKNMVVMPYAIFQGKEQLFNYLFCCGYDNDGNLRNYSYRINRITAVRASEKIIPYTDNIEHHFQLTQKYGASYAINGSEKETCVLLNKSGISSFRQIYFGRPKAERKEVDSNGTYRYYFNCSEEQLYRYFRRFNPGEALVEYPQSLKDRIMKFHRDSLKTYETGRLSDPN